MPPTETILAVDPSLRGTGFAVLEKTGQNVRCLHFGVVKNPPRLSVSGCLVAIHEQLGDVIARFSPGTMAIESVIYVQSFPTAITLGSARGAALLAAAQRGLPIHEYAPRKVKQAVVGNGAAQKSQVAFMVRALLGLTVTPPPDAADALAIGLTHFQAAEAASRRRVPLDRV